MRVKRLIPNIFTYMFLGFGVIIIFIPLYLTIITAFKSPEMLTKSFLALPDKWYFDNFVYLFFTTIKLYLTIVMFDLVDLCE